MVDWFAFVAAVVAIAVSVAACYQTRRQADAADSQVRAAEDELHAARTPTFDAIVTHDPHTGEPELKLTLLTQWPLKQIRLDITDDSNVLQFKPGARGVPLASSIVSKAAFTEPDDLTVHTGYPHRWQMRWEDERPPKPRPTEVRIRVSAYPHVPDNVSEARKQPWARLLTVPVEPRRPGVAGRRP